MNECAVCRARRDADLEAMARDGLREQVAGDPGVPWREAAASAALTAAFERPPGDAAAIEPPPGDAAAIVEWSFASAPENRKREATIALIGLIKAEVAKDRAAMQQTLDLWEQCLPHILGAEALAFAHGWQWGGPEDGMVPAIEALKARLAR